jgi:ApbE superfamily uncharacterized protein (UPF0280 family)
MGDGRFIPYRVCVGESDLWVGIGWGEGQLMPEHDVLHLIHRVLIESRSSMKRYNEKHPGFFSSLHPFGDNQGAPQLVSRMIAAGAQAGTGPMAAVAGAIAEAVGTEVLRQPGVREVIVENGGDIFLSIEREARLVIHAGSSPLSDRLAVVIPAEQTPAGICTSAGTVGPSYSSGNSDAVMVCCRDAALADAFATSFGNRIHSIDDVDRVIEQIKSVVPVISAVIIKDDKAGICGKLEVRVHQ